MERIRSIREEHSLTQEMIAGILGIKRATYTSYEIERDTIPIRHLNKLCNYFAISIDYALGLTTKPKYINSKDDISPFLLQKRLKELRHTNHLTQQQIASVLNISRSTWTGYEYGKYLIPTLLLFALAHEYNYSIDYLLGKINCNYLVKNTPNRPSIHKIK